MHSTPPNADSPAAIGILVTTVTGIITSISMIEMIQGLMQICALAGSIAVSIFTVRYLIRKTRKL